MKAVLMSYIFKKQILKIPVIKKNLNTFKISLNDLTTMTKKI